MNLLLDGLDDAVVDQTEVRAVCRPKVSPNNLGQSPLEKSYTVVRLVCKGVLQLTVTVTEIQNN